MRDIAEEFNQFIAENPKVYELFERFTLDAIRSGRKNFGAQAIIERCRWYSTIETVGDQYKLNNNHVAPITRMFERIHPEHKGFFRTRRSRVDMKGDLFL